MYYVQVTGIHTQLRVYASDESVCVCLYEQIANVLGGGRTIAWVDAMRQYIHMYVCMWKEMHMAGSVIKCTCGHIMYSQKNLSWMHHTHTHTHTTHTQRTNKHTHTLTHTQPASQFPGPGTSRWWSRSVPRAVLVVCPQYPRDQCSPSSPSCPWETESHGQHSQSCWSEEFHGLDGSSHW